MRSYTGIGSRTTPSDVLEHIRKLGKFLARQGFVLRSGGAKGADTAFEVGCDEVGGVKKIFLPWKGFNNHPSELYGSTKGAREIAKKYHPTWDFLLPVARDFMGRNTYQILDLDLKTPAEFVCCWTRNGEIDGGTGQALRIANDLGIPVLNFGFMSLSEIDHKIKELIT